MGRFVDQVANKCGDYFTILGKEGSQIMGSINHQGWLALSTVAVVVGFVFLRSNK